MHTPRSLAIAAVLTLALALPAGAESGTALGVKPEASAKAGSSIRTLVVGADVAIGETVTTGRAGLVQLLFRDKTELVVGPNSSLVIEDYLIRDNNSAGKFAITALSGTFRFVTGGAPKDRYVISTPTGTIGVRGTAFDFTVAGARPDFIPAAALTTSLILYNGAVRLCNRARQCVDVVRACDFGAFNSAGAVAIETARPVRDAFRALFPYASNQNPLLSQFRVANARTCMNPPPSSGGAPSLATPGSGPATVRSTTPTPSDPTPPGNDDPTPPPGNDDSTTTPPGGGNDSDGDGGSNRI